MNQATVDLIGFAVAGAIALFIGLPSAIEGYSKLLRQRRTTKEDRDVFELNEELAKVGGSDVELASLRHRAKRFESSLGVTVFWMILGAGIAIGGVSAEFGYANGAVTGALFLSVYVGLRLFYLRRTARRLLEDGRAAGYLKPPETPPPRPGGR
ncbi:MAG TPA: hypothetical protein VK455_05840 [Thermoplasmata archaeon]|nr:hypothetical protein [Thermoplasmata archaeon]